jgi:hypothetical protein
MMVLGNKWECWVPKVASTAVTFEVQSTRTGKVTTVTERQLYRVTKVGGKFVRAPLTSILSSSCGRALQRISSTAFECKLTGERFAILNTASSIRKASIG